MKISFDLDGTFFSYPDLMGSMAIVFKNSGNEVGVLSSRPQENIEEIFKGFPWDFLIGRTPDDLITTNEMNAYWKAKKIEEHNIDIHFDDLADLIGAYPEKIKNCKVVNIR